MGIIEERQKRDSLVAKSNEKAIEMYDAQLKAIQWIKDKDWFKEIVNYWKRETEACMDALTTAKIDDVTYLQARYSTWKSFLTFLENLSK